MDWETETERTFPNQTRIPALLVASKEYDGDPAPADQPPKSPMPKNSSNRLEDWEVALIKAMLSQGKVNKQTILAYFSRPTRSVNPARIDEIVKKQKHGEVENASDVELGRFVSEWPNINPETGLNLRGDELLIKAREAMIAGIHIYNGANLTFRTELFVVTAIIAWTYLFLYWFSQKRIDYRYKDNEGGVKIFEDGTEHYWDLSRCLKYQPCPLAKGVVDNLKFLIGLRNEIEHRSTRRIDERVVHKLQACCINFNTSIKDFFGARYALEQRLPIALQMATFSSEQRALLKIPSDLPNHIESFISDFEHGLSEQELNDPAYQFRVAFVQTHKNRATGAEEIIRFVGPESEDDKETRVFIRKVDENRYTASQVCAAMHSEGFTEFTVHAHTKLWRDLKGKEPNKEWGKQGDYQKTWVWNDSWLQVVREHCQENRTRFEGRD